MPKATGPSFATVGFDHVDVGHGWLIFALPPSELACIPADTGDTHELYLMCEDIEAFRAKWPARASPAAGRGSAVGLLVRITLPGGSSSACTSRSTSGRASR
jgi:hypothetical protein